MTKTHKIIIIAAVFALCVTSAIAFAAGFTGGNTFADEIKEEYFVGDEFDIPAGKVNADGREVSASATLHYPGGRASASNRQILDESGLYTLEYYADVNGKRYTETKTFKVLDSTIRAITEAPYTTRKRAE